MADRPATFYTMDLSNNQQSSSHRKPAAKKAKPPNLTLNDDVIEKRRHSVHGYPKHNSPPFSPKSPSYSPDGASPGALTANWQQQPRRRSLIPIPEMKLNNKTVNFTNGVHQDEGNQPSTSSTTNNTLDSDSRKIKKDPDFVREVSTPDFSVDDIKVIVGRNKIRIVAEQSRPQSGDDTDDSSPRELHKVVDIPHHIDPLSIKVKKQVGKILIQGYNSLQSSHKAWAVTDNGFLTTQDDNSVRITVNVPEGFQMKNVQLKTLTRHYLVVSVPAAETVDRNGGVTSDFEEIFQLPDEPDKAHISSKLLGQSTVLVEVPLAFRARKYTL